MAKRERHHALVDFLTIRLASASAKWDSRVPDDQQVVESELGRSHSDVGFPGREFGEQFILPEDNREPAFVSERRGGKLLALRVNLILTVTGRALKISTPYCTIEFVLEPCGSLSYM